MISNWYKSEGVITSMRGSGNLQDMMDEIATIDEAKQKLVKDGFEVRDVKFPGEERILAVKIDADTFVIDDSLYVKDANDWIWMIDPSNYVTARDFNKEFWDGARDGTEVYHATTSQNVKDILKNGLRKRSDTRGISNRGFPSAVFTSDNIGDIDSYGDTVIKVDVGAMKRDGYMPNVSLEEPVEEALLLGQVANLIGLDGIGEERMDSLWQEGIRQSTVIFLDDIPPKYLKLMK